MHILQLRSISLPVLKIPFRSVTNHREMYTPINHELVSQALHELTSNIAGKVPQGDDLPDLQHHFAPPENKENKNIAVFFISQKKKSKTIFFWLICNSLFQFQFKYCSQ